MTQIRKMDFNRDEGDERDDDYSEIPFIPFMPVKKIFLHPSHPRKSVAETCWPSLSRQIKSDLIRVICIICG